jgi:hypothetical protein
MRIGPDPTEALARARSQVGDQAAGRVRSIGLHCYEHWGAERVVGAEADHADVGKHLPSPSQLTSLARSDQVAADAGRSNTVGSRNSRTVVGEVATSQRPSGDG